MFSWWSISFESWHYCNPVASGCQNGRHLVWSCFYSSLSCITKLGKIGNGDLEMPQVSNESQSIQKPIVATRFDCIRIKTSRRYWRCLFVFEQTISHRLVVSKTRRPITGDTFGRHSTADDRNVNGNETRVGGGTGPSQHPFNTEWTHPRPDARLSTRFPSPSNGKFPTSAATENGSATAVTELLPSFSVTLRPTKTRRLPSFVLPGRMKARKARRIDDRGQTITHPNPVLSP